MHRYLFYVAGCLAVASTAAADTVLLESGRRMENVIARSTDSGVTIRFSYGELSLPSSMVARVEKSESALERYLARSAELRSDTGATAADWLELALQARAQGMNDGFRRALLRAAELDPDLPEVGAAMRSLDYVLDAERGRWVAFADSAQARAESARREARRRERAALQAAAAHAQRRRELVETLEWALLAQVAEDLSEREAASAPRNGIPLWPQYGPYVAVAHPQVLRSPLGGVAPGWRDTEFNRRTLRELSRRQPGSLLPVTPRRGPERHRGSFKAPSGD